jgi:IclR family pca regulon transcriptional regulator
MRRLCDRLGETVILGALDEDGQVRLLAKVIARQDVRYDVDLATRLPAYCTALGRVTLGRLESDRRHAILTAAKRTKRTPHTVTDLDRLHALIDQTVVQGYTIVAEEFALGGTGVAAPIVDVDGRVIAALNVGCVTARFEAKKLAVVSTLLSEAGNLSAVISQPRPSQPVVGSRRRARATS